MATVSNFCEPAATVSRLREQAVPQRSHLLTVNVEDYFHVAAFRRYISADHWYRFESRLDRNLDETLKLFSETQTRATFFVLGWIAEKHPELVRRISQAGHEVASRGFLHQPLPRLPLPELREDLRRSKAVLEDVTRQPVNGFRLSDGWLQPDSFWMLNEIARAGYSYDSSVMPRRRDHGGDHSRRRIHEIQTDCGPLLEVPLSTLPVAGAWCPIAGGNYLRQFPDQLMRRAIHRWVGTEPAPFVMYFQVWELDPEQPQLAVSGRMTRVRHYRKLGKYRRILPAYLSRYHFTSVAAHAALPDSPLQNLAAEVRTEPQTVTAAWRSAEIPCRPAVAVISKPSAATASSSRPTGSGDGVQQLPVTVVIPCYNEESSLPYLARTLEHLENTLLPDYRPTFLFVDDCSTDNTLETLRELFRQKTNVVIRRHEVNQGVSAAILTGLRNAESAVVCSMDCDCSYDPLELRSMLPLLTADVALVTASPYHPNGRVNNVPAWRLVLSKGLSAMYRLLLSRGLSTWTSCFRVYRRDQILDLPLKEQGFLGTAELAAQLCLRGRSVIEHPATLEVRLFGISKMKTLKTIRDHLGLLARLCRQRLRDGMPAAVSAPEPAVLSRHQPTTADRGGQTCCEVTRQTAESRQF